MKFNDLTGKRFGKVVAISATRKRTPGGTCLVYWQCQCDCGQVANIYASRLIQGKTKSCGCMMRLSGKRNAKHGQSDSRLYRIWKNMIQRCQNPKLRSYASYGGRGISVCDRWKDFAKFSSDVGQPPSDQHSIDRIDNDKGYFPENVRWATTKQQHRNRGDHVYISINGKSVCLADAAEQYGIPYKRFHSRLKKGWPLAEALKPERMKPGVRR